MKRTLLALLLCLGCDDGGRPAVDGGPDAPDLGLDASPPDAAPPDAWIPDAAIPDALPDVPPGLPDPLRLVRRHRGSSTDLRYRRTSAGARPRFC